MGYTIHWTQYEFTDYTYNNVLKLIPRVISPATTFKVFDWGFVLSVSDDDSFCVERNPTQMTFSKTNRLPYTKDAMKALILMVEFGAASELGHDDTDMSWYLTALEEVNAIVPLVSYAQQKETFMSVSAET